MARGMATRAGTSAVKDSFDVIVAGGGVMGAWAAVMAAKRGASVLLMDQFERAHTRGSSHGDGRIYRLAYTEDDYVDMMLHSLPLWRELQDANNAAAAAKGQPTPKPLMATTGGLNVGSADDPELAALQNLYERRGIAHQRLSPGETTARFPQVCPTTHCLLSMLAQHWV